MENYYICDCPVSDVQKEALNILIQIDRICKKNNIRYSLFYGTLLGAVRHEGFIPWDDDLDIIMLREDYEKFCKIANEQLPAPFRFEDCRTRKDYPNHFGKCYNTDTVFVQKAAAHLDLQHSIFVDIFPMDNVDKSNQKVQYRVLSTMNTVCMIKLKLAEFKARHILYLPLFLFPVSVLSKMIEKIIVLNQKKDTEYVGPICVIDPDELFFKKSDLVDTVNGKFEGYEFPIPRNAMGILEQNYKNPMQLPPEDKRNPTHDVIEVKLSK